MGDKWSTRSGQAYDPDRRYVHHSDKRGHSAEIRLRVPPQLIAHIGELVASKKIPEYRRVTDFAADAIVHHLHRISEEIDSGKIRRTLNVLVMLDDAQRQKVEREAFEELIETIDQNAGAFYASPTANKAADWDRLEEYCQELLAAVDGIPPEHRSRYLDRIETHLKASGGARL